MEALAYLNDICRLNMERRSAIALLGAIAKMPGGHFCNRKQYKPFLWFVLGQSLALPLPEIIQPSLIARMS